MKINKLDIKTENAASVPVEESQWDVSDQINYGWEAEFDSIVANCNYYKYTSINRFCCGGDYCTKNHNEWIKQFISRTVNKAVKEERNRIIQILEDLKY